MLRRPDTATAGCSIRSFFPVPCMAWRSICTRYLSRRRELVPADQGGVVAEDLAAAVDFPEAGSAVVVAERSNFAARMVRPERLELPTLCSEGRCSIQLSYGAR